MYVALTTDIPVWLTLPTLLPTGQLWYAKVFSRISILTNNVIKKKQKNSIRCGTRGIGARCDTALKTPSKKHTGDWIHILMWYYMYAVTACSSNLIINVKLRSIQPLQIISKPFLQIFASHSILLSQFGIYERLRKWCLQFHAELPF